MEGESEKEGCAEDNFQFSNRRIHEGVAFYGAKEQWVKRRFIGEV